MSVTITLTSNIDEDCEYREITIIQSDVLVNSRKVGTIDAWLVNRQRIPERLFYSAFDGHSADMQWIGCTLMEPRLGRTTLNSLADYDDPKFEFLYIRDFQVEGTEDVKTQALREFLHHPFLIRGNSTRPGLWRLSSVAYVLDPVANISNGEEKNAFDRHQKECNDEHRDKMLLKTGFSQARRDALAKEKRRWGERLDELARKDANPFLRNGFFQDPALARQIGCERILVASCGHFQGSLKSHREAAAVRLIPSTRPNVANEAGKDKELFEFIKKTCSGSRFMMDDEQGTTRALTPIRNEVHKLVSEGATVANSHTLHVACFNDDLEVVKILLEIELACLNSFDTFNFTPLMVAAESAAGRSTKDGISDTRVVNYLLSRGADKTIQDPNGLTAYGHYKAKKSEYDIMLASMMGCAISSEATTMTPSERALEAKLLPPGGPSAADLSGGIKPGFVDYSREDRRSNNVCHDFSDEDSYGGYSREDRTSNHFCHDFSDEDSYGDY